jgi:hypothetical protein
VLAFLSGAFDFGIGVKKGFVPSGLYTLFPLPIGGVKFLQLMSPCLFVTTHFWWCELFLSLFDSFRSLTLLFGVAKHSWLIGLSFSLSLLFGDAKGLCLLWACFLVAEFWL